MPASRVLFDVSTELRSQSANCVLERDFILLFSALGRHLSLSLDSSLSCSMPVKQKRDSVSER